MLFNRKIQNFDFLLFALVIALTVFGIIAIGSATHINWVVEGKNYIEFRNQIIFFVLGIVVLVAVAAIDYNFLQQFFWVAYIANILMLILVLLIGDSANGAQRWLEVGTIRLQPSEFSKVVMIFCNAAMISKYWDRINEFKILMLLGAFAFAPIFLILLQPSLSTSLVVLVVFLFQIFVAGVAAKYIYTTIAVAAPAVVVFFLDIRSENSFIVNFFKNFAGGKFEYQITRILANQDKAGNVDAINYQISKSVRAIGSGKFSGRGLYGGTLNKLSYLPEQHNDFIFSVIGEEFGFIGSVLVIFVILIIILRCVQAANKSLDLFGCLICMGVAGMLAFQTFVNIGVATAVLPTTGMALPFISAGGSSLLTNMIAIGLVLNVRLKTEKSLFKGD